MNLLLIILAPLFLYFIYKTIYLYYNVYYYGSQGIPLLRFPLPIVGNLPIFLKHLKNLDKYSLRPLVETFKREFKGKVPGIFIDFRTHCGTITFSDPELINEIYITKNKYFDKHIKTKTRVERLVKNGILLSQSNELWAKKRKRLSLAFYKEKLN